jgi:hypothetical protein
MLLFGLGRGGLCDTLGAGVRMLVFRVQVGLIRMLKSLSGAFVPGQVIFFTVMLGAGTVGVGGKVAVLGCYLL